MANEIILTCDRCGNKIKGAYTILEAESTHKYELMRCLEFLSPGVGPLDICPNCMDSFKKWLRNGGIYDIRRKNTNAQAVSISGTPY